MGHRYSLSCMYIGLLNKNNLSFSFYSAFVPLYRVTHGLLCGGGKVFPAMVLDNF